MVTNIALVLSHGVTPVDEIDLHTKLNCISTLSQLGKIIKNGEIIIFSVGGIFQPKNIQNTPTSILMEKFMQNNIKTNISFLHEETSINTWQGIKNFNEKMKNENINVSKVYVFADKLHSKRAKILLKHYGYKNIIIPKSYIELDLKETINEIILILMTLIDPKGKKFK